MTDSKSTLPPVVRIQLPAALRIREMLHAFETDRGPLDDEQYAAIHEFEARVAEAEIRGEHS